MTLDDFMFEAIYWPWNLMSKMPKGPLRLIPFVFGAPWVLTAMVFIGMPCMVIILVLEICSGDL